jgi:hypothetical protein
MKIANSITFLTTIVLMMVRAEMQKVKKRLEGAIMSLIHCSCDCLYQHEGYCELEKAAEITNYTNNNGCLHFVPSTHTKSDTDSGEKTHISGIFPAE